MRFDRPGERLLAARVDDILGAIGGPTLDPIVAGAIRMRRFSLRPPLRNRGLDRGLATALLEEPRRSRTLVTVSAAHGSAPFWETLGFVPAARGGAPTSFPVRPIEIRSEKASRQFPTTPVFGPGLSTRRSRTIARRAGAGTKGRSSIRTSGPPALRAPARPARRSAAGGLVPTPRAAASRVGAREPVPTRATVLEPSLPSCPPAVAGGGGQSTSPALSCSQSRPAL